MVNEPEDRFSRLRLAGWQSPVLQAAHVMVAGAGALGNEVIKNLALLGVGHLLIVDFDTIEITNLSRSVLFRESDVGRSKAAVAAQRAKELNPDMDVAWLPGDVAHDLGAGVFRRMDAVIGCLDNRAARLAINLKCRHVQRPWVDGALDGLNGLVRVFAPVDGPCYECTLTEADYADLRRRHSCQGIPLHAPSEGLIATTPTSASLIAALQVQQAMQLLHGLPVPFGCEIVYSSTTYELLNVHLREKENCLSHELAEPLIELARARTADMTLGQLLLEAQRVLGPRASLRLSEELVLAQICASCHLVTQPAVLVHKLTERDVACPQCGQEWQMFSTHSVTSESDFLNLRLSDAGFAAGEIVRAQLERSYAYLELSGDFPEALAPNRSA